LRDLESISETIDSLEQRCDELQETIDVHKRELITNEECEQMLSELSDALALLPPNKQKKLIELTVKEVVCTSTELEVSLLITAIRHYKKLPTDMKKFATRGGWYTARAANSGWGGFILGLVFGAALGPSPSPSWLPFWV
jgi:hypothetical protein